MLIFKVEGQPSYKEFTTDWSIVGNGKNVLRALGSAENPDVLIPVFDFVADLGGDNSGETDNSDNLNEFLNNFQGPVKILFPAGKFLFRKTIFMRSDVIIEGYSPLLTVFLFDLENDYTNLFSLIGKHHPEYYEVIDPSVKDSYKMALERTSGLNIGDDVDLEQRNDNNMYFTSDHNKPWAEWSVGQMLKIKGFSEDTIFFDRSLTNNYNIKLDLRLSRVEMIREVYFRKFSIIRLDKGIGSNFYLYHAANIDISCIFSKFASQSHVNINRSRNIEIKGNVFYDAMYHCGGGSGYGVFIKKHSTECLVTNNIFDNLRHAMIIKEGANRNVFSYNYSNKVKISDGYVLDGFCYNERIVPFPDISIHGHYSYMNLFEGNVVKAIHSADNWGPTGPGTTFFRNLVESEYGIKIWMGSDEHNVIGNVIPNGTITTDNYTFKVNRIKNKERNFILRNKEYNLRNSFYLDKVPSFYENIQWPSIDPENPEHSTNPAKERWANGKVFDETCCGYVPGLNVLISTQNSFSNFYEKGYLYNVGMDEQILKVSVIDLHGRTIYEATDFESSIPQYVGYLKNGLYLAHYKGIKTNHVVKFIVQN